MFLPHPFTRVKEKAGMTTAPVSRDSELKLEKEVLKIANYFHVLGLRHYQFIEYLLDIEGVSRFDLF